MARLAFLAAATIALCGAVAGVAQTRPAAQAGAGGVASPTPAAQVEVLLRAGRTANSNARYPEAEASFRQALELETGAAHSADAVVTATLLDLALNVSNQGRSDEAAALLRRAEPLVQRDASRVPRARLATYRALASANGGDFAGALPEAREAAGHWRALSTARQGQEVGADAESEIVAAGEPLVRHDPGAVAAGDDTHRAVLDRRVVQRAPAGEIGGMVARPAIADDIA